MTGDAPHSLAMSRPSTRDALTDEQFDEMMQRGYEQALSGDVLPIDEAFAAIRESI